MGSSRSVVFRRNFIRARHACPATVVAAFMRLCFGQWCIPWPGRKKPTTITGVPTDTTTGGTSSAQSVNDDDEDDNVSISSAIDVASVGEEAMTRALPSDASSAGKSTRIKIFRSKT